MPALNAFVPCLGITYSGGALTLIGVTHALTAKGKGKVTLGGAKMYFRLLEATGASGTLAVRVVGPPVLKLARDSVTAWPLVRLECPCPPVDRAGVAETWLDVPRLQFPITGTYNLVLELNGVVLGSLPFVILP